MIEERTNKCRGTCLHILLFGMCFCTAIVCWEARLHAGCGSKEEQIPHASDKDQRDESDERAHAAGANSNKPCAPTEADEDPDVAKRPCFVHALNKARVNLGVFLSPGAITLPGNISGDGMVRLQHTLEQVLVEGAMPSDRNGVRQWAVATQASPDKPWIEAVSWETPMGKMIVSRRVGKESSLRLLLKLAEQHRLPVSHHGPPDSTFDKEYPPYPIGRFIDPDALDRVLTRVLRLPGEDHSDYFARGSDREYAGVPVFVGLLQKSWQSIGERPAARDPVDRRSP